MTADIINLRKARKEKFRIEAQRAAAGNRIRFGRTKAEKKKNLTVNELNNAKLDGARLSNSSDPDDLDPGAVS